MWWGRWKKSEIRLKSIYLINFTDVGRLRGGDRWLSHLPIDGLCVHTHAQFRSHTHFHLTNSISHPLCYLFRGFALLGHLRPSRFQHQISFNQHIALRHLQFLLYACMEKTSPPPVDPLMAHRRETEETDRSEKRAHTICWCVIFFSFRWFCWIRTLKTFGVYFYQQEQGLHYQVLWLIPKHQGGAHTQTQVFISAVDAVWQV